MSAQQVTNKSFTVQFESAAQADISDAFDWYELQSFGLGGEFLRALAYPDIVRGFRRILLRRFPYGLHYEIINGDVVSVLACLHQRRDPAVWPSAQ